MSDRTYKEGVEEFASKLDSTPKEIREMSGVFGKPVVLVSELRRQGKEEARKEYADRLRNQAEENRQLREKLRRVLNRNEELLARVSELEMARRVWTI